MENIKGIKKQLSKLSRDDATNINNEKYASELCRSVMLQCRNTEVTVKSYRFSDHCISVIASRLN